MSRNRLRTSWIVCACLAAGAVGFGPARASAAPGTGKIAHFHLSGAVTETPIDDPFGLTGGQATSLKKLLERLGKARRDDSVKAVAITLGSLGMGSGQLEEVRQALAKFKAVDKRVFVHVESVSMGTLALLSAASDVSIVPTADVWLTGLYVEAPYLKGLLDKIGVEAEIIHIGDFKSAGETLSREGPSEPAAANMNWLLDGLYDSLVRMIAESRGMTEKKLRKIIDNGPYSAEEAKELGLVDDVQYRDEFLSNLKSIYGDDVEIDNRYGEKDAMAIDFSNPFAFFTMFSDMLKSGGAEDKDAIAIVYVEGAISPGHGQPSPFGGSSGAFSGDIAKALETAADDPRIKAVVLRVDSPGGSALASEIIWRATQRVRAKKPLVVSMGNVAGSGGYYVACGADVIFADEMTITASIGVVGGKLITDGLWDKCGVNWHAYRRGENADIMSTSKHFSPRQRDQIHDWMNDIYGVFKSRVTKGRQGKLQKPIDELAAGRVFTGGQALELGLVDRLGGMADAVEHAARLAKIGDYDVRVVPKPKNFIELIMSELSGEGSRPTDLRLGASMAIAGRQPDLLDLALPFFNRLDPARVNVLTQAIQRLELIHRESVILMMPDDLLVRTR